MTSKLVPNIGFIGGGNMARSLVGGLIANRTDRSTITISDPSPEARQRAADDYEVRVTSDNDEVISNSSYVILAVKPKVMRPVLVNAQSVLRQHQPVLISIAAGITTDSIDSWSGGGFAIIRVMPNTPALIQEGMSALFANDRVSTVRKQYAESILSAVGKTVWMDQESKLDAVTAVSGSGPAYFFYLIEAIQAGAVELGLDPHDAHLLAIQTAVGAALLAQRSDESPAKLRKQVTSPGGTTEAALRVMQSAKMKDSMIKAMAAAQNRAIEMAQHTD